MTLHPGHLLQQWVVEEKNIYLQTPSVFIGLRPWRIPGRKWSKHIKDVCAQNVPTYRFSLNLPLLPKRPKKWEVTDFVLERTCLGEQPKYEKTRASLAIKVGRTEFLRALLLIQFSAHTRIAKTNMPSIEQSFHLLSTHSIWAIFLYNWMQCNDGFSLLSQIYIRKGKDAKNSVILSFFFVTERTQLNAANV